jgi:hypothetical protein
VKKDAGEEWSTFSAGARAVEYMLRPKIARMNTVKRVNINVDLEAPFGAPPCRDRGATTMETGGDAPGAQRAALRVTHEWVLELNLIIARQAAKRATTHMECVPAG